MPEAQQVTKESKAAEPTLPNSRFTYFMMLPDQYEQRVMLAYIAQKYPQSEARKVSELRVDRLTDLHSVIVLVRPRPTPAATQFKNGMGVSEFQHHEPEEKLKEVRESRPILVKTFFKAPGAVPEFNEYGDRPEMSLDNEVGDGELNISNFLTALAQAASPMTLNWHPTQLPGIVRLAWV